MFVFGAFPVRICHFYFHEVCPCQERYSSFWLVAAGAYFCEWIAQKEDRHKYLAFSVYFFDKLHASYTFMVASSHQRNGAHIFILLMKFLMLYVWGAHNYLISIT